MLPWRGKGHIRTTVVLHWHRTGAVSAPHGYYIGATCLRHFPCTGSALVLRPMQQIAQTHPNARPTARRSVAAADPHRNIHRGGLGGAGRAVYGPRHGRCGRHLRSLRLGVARHAGLGPRLPERDATGRAMPVAACVHGRRGQLWAGAPYLGRRLASRLPGW